MSQSLRLSKTYSLSDLPDTSPRRYEMIILKSEGKTFKEIANIQGVSRATVQQAFTRMYSQYGCKNYLDLTIKCMQVGII